MDAEGLSIACDEDIEHLFTKEVEEQVEEEEGLVSTF
jgi:hypothetical protein